MNASAFCDLWAQVRFWKLHVIKIGECNLRTFKNHEMHEASSYETSYSINVSIATSLLKSITNRSRRTYSSLINQKCDILMSNYYLYVLCTLFITPGFMYLFCLFENFRAPLRGPKKNTKTHTEFNKT